MEDVLQVNSASAGATSQVLHAFGQVLGECHVGEDAEVGRVEESQASLALQLPKVTIRVDDAISYTS